ncbi:MAG TPA: HU family DNA-binding protein [Candidatus Binatia bacterium]|nr:HU family DNA-binding protein [Candidatus Binatia bacterium]
MTRADLVEVLAFASGSSKAAAARALGAFLAGIRDGLRHGGSATISGFGTFVVAKRAARNGTNPRTGRGIRIPPARVPRFRPSRGLRAALR